MHDSGMEWRDRESVSVRHRTQPSEGIAVPPYRRRFRPVNISTPPVRRVSAWPSSRGRFPGTAGRPMRAATRPGSFRGHGLPCHADHPCCGQINIVKCLPSMKKTRAALREPRASNSRDKTKRQEQSAGAGLRLLEFQAPRRGGPRRSFRFLPVPFPSRSAMRAVEKQHAGCFRPQVSLVASSFRRHSFLYRTRRAVHCPTSPRLLCGTHHAVQANDA